MAPLTDNYDAMKAWLAHFESTIAPTGYIYNGFSFGDWVAPGFGSTGGDPEGTRLVGTATSTRPPPPWPRLPARSAGPPTPSTSTRWRGRSRTPSTPRSSDTSAETYYDDRSAGYRQTSNLLPLSLGIVPAPTGRPCSPTSSTTSTRVASTSNTGALGTKILLPLLTDTGNAQLAYQVATNPTYPAGATGSRPSA